MVTKNATHLSILTVFLKKLKAGGATIKFLLRFEKNRRSGAV